MTQATKRLVVLAQVLLQLLHLVCELARRHIVVGVVEAAHVVQLPLAHQTVNSLRLLLDCNQVADVLFGDLPHFDRLQALVGV